MAKKSKRRRNWGKEADDFAKGLMAGLKTGNDIQTSRLRQKLLERQLADLDRKDRNDPRHAVASGKQKALNDFYKGSGGETRGGETRGGAGRIAPREIYGAAIKAGFSENQAKALTAEIGRETDFNSKYIYGTHTDANNRKSNVGLISWQGDRATKLYDYLGKEGVLENGKIVPGEKSLVAQFKFMRDEMSNGKHYGLTREQFLYKPDVDYKTAERVLGKNFIRWDYDGRRINAADHHAKRDRYYAELDDDLKKNPYQAAPEQTGEQDYKPGAVAKADNPPVQSPSVGAVDTQEMTTPPRETAPSAGAVGTQDATPSPYGALPDRSAFGSQPAPEQPTTALPAEPPTPPVRPTAALPDGALPVEPTEQLARTAEATTPDEDPVELAQDTDDDLGGGWDFADAGAIDGPAGLDFGALVQNGGMIQKFAVGGAVQPEEETPVEQPAAALDVGPSRTAFEGMVNLDPDAPDPSPAAPRQAQPQQGDISNPITGAFRGIAKMFGLENGALPGADPQREQNLQRFARGEGALTTDQMKQVRQHVDPTGELPEALASVRGLHAGYEFLVGQGRVDEAQKYAAAFVMKARDTSMRLGAAATEALRRGDQNGAMRAVRLAFNQIPDGQQLDIEQGEGGPVAVVKDAQTGEVKQRFQVTPQVIAAAAMGLREGTQFYDHMQRSAGSKLPGNELGGRTQTQGTDVYKGAIVALSETPDGEIPQMVPPEVFNKMTFKEQTAYRQMFNRRYQQFKDGRSWDRRLERDDVHDTAREKREGRADRAEGRSVRGMELREGADKRAGRAEERAEQGAGLRQKEDARRDERQGWTRADRGLTPDGQPAPATPAPTTLAAPQTPSAWGGARKSWGQIAAEEAAKKDQRPAWMQQYPDAEKAPDGKYYVQRDGKWFEVRP